MSVRRSLAGLTLALILAACAKPAEQATTAAVVVDSAAVKAAAADVWQRWSAALVANSADSMAMVVSDSARIDARGMPPVLGRAAFRTAAEQALKGAKYTSLVITPEMTEAIGNELAYETGNYTEAYVMGGKTMTDYGRYAAAVGKDADGQWRVMYLMAFADSTVTAK